jgi:PAS domain S-box-containing protein
VTFLIWTLVYDLHQGKVVDGTKDNRIRQFTPAIKICSHPPILIQGKTMEKEPGSQTPGKKSTPKKPDARVKPSAPGTGCAAHGFGLADFENAADGICVCHAVDTFPYVRFIFWNQQMIEMSGYDMETINRKGWYQSVYPDPDVQSKAIARMDQMRAGADIEAEEWEITRADGQQRMVRISTSLIKDGAGEPRIMAIIHDITQLKQSQDKLTRERKELESKLADTGQALETSGARYRALFENAGDAIFIHDLEGTIIDVNQKTLDIFGYTRQEILSLNISKLHPPESSEQSRLAFETIMRDGQVTFEIDFLAKSGEVIPTEVTSNLNESNGRQIIQGIVRDIRERQLAQQARRETFAIIESSPVTVFLWQNVQDWPVAFVTHNVAQIFGYPDTDFLSGHVLYSQVIHPEDLERVGHEVDTFSQDPEQNEFEHIPYRVVTKEGDVRWVADKTFIRRDHTGAITHYQGIVEDITKRIKAEEALRESEEKFSRAFHSSPDAIVISSLQDGALLEVNEGFAELSGYEREAVIGRTTIDLNMWVDPDDRDRYTQMMMENGHTRNQEFRFRIKSGQIRNGLLSGEIVQIGSEKCLLATIRDITDLKRVEAEVLREKRFSDTLINQLPGSFYMFAENGQMLRWNKSLANISGYASEEIQQMNALDFFPEEEKAHVKGRIGEVFIEGQSQVEANFLTKDGAKIPHVLNGSRIEYDGAHYLLGIGLDITERKQTEIALTESQERFNQIAENIKEVFWLFDWQKQRVLYVSPAYDLIWGRSRESLYSRYEDWAESIHPDDASHAEKTFDRILETGGGETREYRIVKPDGSVRWVSDTGYAIKNEDGEIVRITGIAEDITDRKMIAEALNREKERLAVTLRSIGDAVIATDRSECVTLMNPIAENLTGWPESEAVGRPLSEVFVLVNEMTGQPGIDPVQAVLKTGKIQGLSNHTTLINRDGNRYSIADSAAPIKDANGKIAGVVLVFRDITAAKRTETELLKMEKLKSLGVLAGGIAHDFNNFLTGIIGNLSLAKLDIEPGSRIIPQLNEMEKAALRAKDLTQQLLTFSKGGDPVKGLTQMDILVREAALFALRGSNVRCEFNFADDLWAVHVDAGQMAQVIHNLVLNADQAMPEGGEIRIDGMNIPDGSGKGVAFVPGQSICITIEDQGTGINQEYVNKIFDPYFTTKQKGSGLGLAIVYSIIERHDGYVTVDSKPGMGTTFKIYLPASPDSAEKGAGPDTALVSGTGFILIMDDEAFIRTLLAEMLKKMGYESALAKDGAEALVKYGQAMKSGRPFDAVILDLTVPGGMGGKETIAKLTEMDRHVKAIVSSGYSHDPVMSNYKAHGFMGAVKKPYVIKELSEVLKKIK